MRQCLVEQISDRGDRGGRLNWLIIEGRRGGVGPGCCGRGGVQERVGS